MDNNRYYSIVAPRIVRPNSEYHVAVSIVGVSEPTTTFVELSGQLDSGESFAVSESIVVEPYATRVLALEVSFFFSLHSTIVAFARRYLDWFLRNHKRLSKRWKGCSCHWHISFAEKLLQPEGQLCAGKLAES